MLTITKKDFLKIYEGTEVVQYVDLFYTQPTNQSELLNIYLPSKLWRLNNLYSIVNKRGQLIPFRMNRAQHKVYAESLRHSRLIILKSRQQGISTLWLISFFDDAITRKTFSIGLMAQGVDEAATLLDRVKILWESLDPELKRFLNVFTKKDNTKEFSFSNGSNIYIRTSFRSATLQRLHISEMGKIANKYPDKAQETKTGTLQAIAPGNTAVIESTAEGNNLFKDMWDNAVKYIEQLAAKDFYPVFLSWIDDPDCIEVRPQRITEKHAKYFAELEKQLGVVLSDEQKNFWIVQYRELGEKIYQEYPSTPLEAFMATKDGTYYAKLYMEHVKMQKREIKDLYDKNIDVQVAVDLGMNDTCVLTVFQCWGAKDELQYRIIDEIFDSGKRIKYYCDQINGNDKLGIPRKPYADLVNHIILPHDAEVTEQTSGLTRTEVYQSEFPNASVTVLERTSRNEGIEQVRQMITKLWIDPACEYLIECMYNYCKVWDEKRERWKDEPAHDEYSNGADSLRYMVKGARTGNTQKTPVRRKRGHDV